jgi:hypothetical protein
MISGCATQQGNIYTPVLIHNSYPIDVEASTVLPRHFKEFITDYNNIIRDKVEVERSL